MDPDCQKIQTKEFLLKLKELFSKTSCYISHMNLSKEIFEIVSFLSKLLYFALRCPQRDLNRTSFSKVSYFMKDIQIRLDSKLSA